MIPQAYPLWITVVDSDVRDPEEIKGATAKAARLNAATYRVIGWVELEPEPDFDPTFSPVIVNNGTMNPRAYPLNRGEEGEFHFYGEHRMAAMNRAMASCYPRGLPVDATSAVQKYV